MENLKLLRSTTTADHGKELLRRKGIGNTGPLPRMEALKEKKSKKKGVIKKRVDHRDISETQVPLFRSSKKTYMS